MKIRVLMACVLTAMMVTPMGPEAHAKPGSASQKPSGRSIKTAKQAFKTAKQTMPPQQVKKKKQLEEKRKGRRITTATSWALWNQFEQAPPARPKRSPARSVSFGDRNWKGWAGSWEPVRPRNRD